MIPSRSFVVLVSLIAVSSFAPRVRAQDEPAPQQKSIPAPVPVPVPTPEPKQASKKPDKGKSAATLPKLLQEVEAKYSKAQTLSAKFEQTVETALSKQKQASEGTLVFKRPNRIRWETLKPDRSLFVSDGTTAWFYTPPFDPADKEEHGEYHTRKAAQAESKLANALLSGSFSITRDMSIKQDSPTSFTLSPRKKSSDRIRKAVIDIDPDSDLIHKVTVEHLDGNKTEISLTEIVLGKTVDNTRFVFTPPPNTDKVDDGG